MGARAARAPSARRLVALGLARRLGAPPATHEHQARGPGRGACWRRPMGMGGRAAAAAHHPAADAHNIYIPTCRRTGPAQ